ncbi:MAG: hypothetical protein JSV88_04170 [Candidatus Aminicenantes bacterium]|nr:MAG: hypothetical protein JSV88_04170 [Candidatus Aminicenantes bacterium]
MKHFEAEEIARFAEGKVKDSEQETFIRHLAECGECFKAYTDTLKFIEEEYKKRFTLKFPNLEKIKIALHCFWQDMRTLVRNRRPVLVPVFAALIIVLLIVPFSLKTLHEKRIQTAKIQQIGMDYKNTGAHGFAPSRDKPTAALRTGIFVEDLTLVVNAGGNEELKTKITNSLSSQLKIFTGEENPLLRELVDIEKKNLPGIVQQIPNLFGHRSLAELFRFGRFTAHSLLLTFEKKLPPQSDIEKYLAIARKHDLPQGVLKNLEKLKANKGVEPGKKSCIAIKDIILE